LVVSRHEYFVPRLDVGDAISVGQDAGCHQWMSQSMSHCSICITITITITSIISSSSIWMESWASCPSMKLKLEVTSLWINFGSKPPWNGEDLGLHYIELLRYNMVDRIEVYYKLFCDVFLLYVLILCFMFHDDLHVRLSNLIK
jgi:hypothetical protein